MRAHAATAVLFTFLLSQPATDAKPQAARVPDQTLVAPSGKETKLSALWNQQPLVLVIYRGHWCPLCRKQLSDLGKAGIDKRGALLVPVSIDAPKENVALKKRLGLTVDIYQDKGGALAKALGLWDAKNEIPLPGTFVVSKGGVVAYSHRGKSKIDRPTTSDVVKALPSKP